MITGEAFGAKIKPIIGTIMLLSDHVDCYRAILRKPIQGLSLAVWSARPDISFERIAAAVPVWAALLCNGS